MFFFLHAASVYHTLTLSVCEKLTDLSESISHCVHDTINNHALKLFREKCKLAAGTELDERSYSRASKQSVLHSPNGAMKIVKFIHFFLAHQKAIIYCKISEWAMQVYRFQIATRNIYNWYTIHIYKWGTVDSGKENRVWIHHTLFRSITSFLFWINLMSELTSKKFIRTSKLLREAIMCLSLAAFSICLVLFGALFSLLRAKWWWCLRWKWLQRKQHTNIQFRKVDTDVIINDITMHMEKMY